MPPSDLPPSTLNFITHYVRSIEQLEILLLLARNPMPEWTVEKVYDVLLSTPQSVENWLEEMVRSGIVEKSLDPPRYRCCTEPGLATEIQILAELYRTKPVRVIETIYKPKASAAQSFADAFRIKNPNQNP